MVKCDDFRYGVKTELSTKHFWPAFLTKHCQIGKSTANKYIALAEGRTSLPEIRQGYAKANAKRNTGHVHGQSVENLQQEQQDEERAPDPLAEQRSIVTRVMRDLDLPKMTLLAKYATCLSKASTNREAELAVLEEYLLEPHHTKLLTLASESWDRATQARV